MNVKYWAGYFSHDGVKDSNGYGRGHGQTHASADYNAAKTTCKASWQAID